MIYTSNGIVLSMSFIGWLIQIGKFAFIVALIESKNNPIINGYKIYKTTELIPPLKCNTILFGSIYNWALTSTWGFPSPSILKNIGALMLILEKYASQWILSWINKNLYQMSNFPFPLHPDILVFICDA